jgi:hypothetical protein
MATSEVADPWLVCSSFSADGRRDRWDVDGPLFAGWEMYHLKRSSADPKTVPSHRIDQLVRPADPASDDGGMGAACRRTTAELSGLRGYGFTERPQRLCVRSGSSVPWRASSSRVDSAPKGYRSVALAIAIASNRPSRPALKGLHRALLPARTISSAHHSGRGRWWSRTSSALGQAERRWKML